MEVCVIGMVVLVGEGGVTEGVVVCVSVWVTLGNAVVVAGSMVGVFWGGTTVVVV
jgi:hypothetical protein